MHGGGRTAADESAACTGRRRRARQTAEKADRTRKSSIWEIQTAPPRPKIHREMRVGLHLRWDLERGGAVWTTNIGKFRVRGDQHSGCLQGGLCRQRDTATEAHTLKHSQGGRKISQEPKENYQQPGKPTETQRPWSDRKSLCIKALRKRRHALLTLIVCFIWFLVGLRPKLGARECPTAPVDKRDVNQRKSTRGIDSEAQRKLNYTIWW